MRRPTALARRYGRARKAGSAFTPDKAKIQALLFPRSEWAIGDALVWASVHGFSTRVHDTTDSHVRVYPKGKGKKARAVRTIPYGIGGTRAVVEWR